MATPIRPSLLCSRRLARLGLQHQVRGKTKLVPVRLRKNVKAFGPEGSVVPVQAAKMRNSWACERVADYLTPAEIRELRTKDVAIERDYMFGLGGTQEVAEAAPVVLDLAKPKPIQMGRMSPQRATELLSIFVPPHIDIFGPATTPEAPVEAKQETQARQGRVSAADVLAASYAPQPTTQPTTQRAVRLYGSVSTADVAARIKALLAGNDEAGRVVVSEKDVRFTSGTTEEEADRVRHLGEYEIEIKVKGAEESVRRKVRIKALK